MVAGPRRSDAAVSERLAYERLDKRIFTRYVKPLVTMALIEEHRRTPLGIHSDALERVLRYVRRNQGRQDGQYVIVTTVPSREWAVARLSGTRRVPAEIDGEDRFFSRAEAEHAVFLRRLRDLGLEIEALRVPTG